MFQPNSGTTYHNVFLLFLEEFCFSHFYKTMGVFFSYFLPQVFSLEDNIIFVRTSLCNKIQNNTKSTRKLTHKKGNKEIWVGPRGIHEPMWSCIREFRRTFFGCDQKAWPRSSIFALFNFGSSVLRQMDSVDRVEVRPWPCWVWVIFYQYKSKTRVVFFRNNWSLGWLTSVNRHSLGFSSFHFSAFKMDFFKVVHL